MFVAHKKKKKLVVKSYVVGHVRTGIGVTYWMSFHILYVYDVVPSRHCWLPLWERLGRPGERLWRPWWQWAKGWPEA